MTEENKDSSSVPTNAPMPDLQRRLKELKSQDHSLDLSIAMLELQNHEHEEQKGRLETKIKDLETRIATLYTQLGHAMEEEYRDKLFELHTKSQDKPPPSNAFHQ